MTELIKLPLISFVVTSFNYEKYIIKTLESIKNQSYENIEIIVVDDKSDDNSVLKIKGFSRHNPDFTVKLIEHAENKGQMASMQSGLMQVNGQFVCFIDSDDVLVKDYAKTLLRVHLSSSVAFVSGQLIEIGENDEIHTTYSVSSFQKEKNFELKSLDELLKIDIDNVDFKVLTLKEAPFGGWHWSAMSANMFRKSVLDLFLLYDTPENWKICPDKFLLNFAHLIGDSAIVYAPLVGYRRHLGNAGCSKLVCGCKRYNNDEITKINIENNKKIRKDALNFIKKNKSSFIAKLGKRGVNYITWQVRLSYFKIDFKKAFGCLFKI
ncbi:MAG: glycosyltransferase [Candidatus Gastranaerophilales bacterium]|nr:glycosyltransferase [Candidatus Gastranaerophilales bacterium]